MTTAQHTVGTVHGWVRGDQLTIGGVLVTRARPVSIRALSKRATDAPLLNLHIYERPSFVVEGVVVHCHTEALRIRA